MILETVTNLIYPHDGICLVCGMPTHLGLCEFCDYDVKSIKGHTCIQCGIEVENAHFICYECAQYEQIFSQISAVGYYEGTLKKMILDLKYHRKTYLAKKLAQMMADRIYNTMWTDNIDYIIPIPLSKKRLKKRGFNQMQLIGEELSHILNIALINDGLVRVKNTKPLKGLSRNSRMETVKNAFRVNDEHVLGSHILLIDDVFTTGSTLRESSKILIEAGALSVSIGVIARARDIKI